MGYNLTIDQGNSTAKAVVWHDDKFVAESFHDTLSPREIREIVDCYGVSAAIYCSVASSGLEIVNALRQYVTGNVIELTHLTPMPIGIDYATAETLGRDRIAAAVGAHAKAPGRASLVVDMGTAVTYDVVTANARFAGGNIAPGVGMRFDALHHFTARLPLVSASGDCPLWGVDTTTAIRSGVLHGIVSEISYYRAQLPRDTKVILTGGWAETIEPMLNFETEIDPHLVNRGLNCILQYNETL